MTGPVLFLVPARGGSRRIPGKNLRPVAGIPLVARAIRCARLAADSLPGGPHRIVCSTDDPRIAEVARAWGAETPFRRPSRLASSTASSVDVALHALDILESPGDTFRALALVQPTSPLTEPSDLRSAIERFDATGHRPVVSVTRTHPAAWHRRLSRSSRLTLDAGASDKAVHLLSGAFYIVEPSSLRRTRRLVDGGRTIGYEVPPGRSVDVDDETDLVAAEALASAQPVAPVRIGPRSIGGGGVFVIAEAGVNHDGSVAVAHRLVDAAADAGADAVKFQTFDPESLASAGAPLAEYQQVGDRAATDQREMLARLALPADSWEGLQAHARDRGILFLSSPFDDASAGLLDRLDVQAIKVPSGELTNLPFLARLARYGRPLLVSTGMADIREVADAVDAIRAAGDPGLALMHCVSTYPAESGDANLRAIQTLRAAFSVPSGWSDHTLGVAVPVAAAALGASIIEKHLTLDRTRAGPDHQASLEPSSFAEMVRHLRVAVAALGSGRKEPVAAERGIAAVARKSIHWRRSLGVGELVGEDDLTLLRPGTGLMPGRLSELVGGRTTRRVTAGMMVAGDDIDRAG